MKIVRNFLLVAAAALLLAACGLPAPSPATLSARVTVPGISSSAGETAGAGETAAPAETATQVATATPSIAPTDEEPVRFAVIGDYGQEGRHDFAVAEMIDSWDVDFIATTGDNNYPIGAAATIDDNVGQYYHRYIGHYQGEYFGGSRENRFFPSLGNHDWSLGNINAYLDYFTLPGNERYYSVEWPPVALFILDSDTYEPDGVGVSSKQAAWLKEAMQASDAQWKLVIMHHPAYSSGHHGSSAWMRWPFAEWGADAVLAGHDHLYERLEVDGLLYFTNGLGGHEARYNFENILPESQVRYNAEHGAMLIEATHARIRFEFINVDGEVIDSVTLPAE